ncbi:MAG: hypothetical protein CVU57_29710 [Deltaproteobacteria bacterium HGW-Deltaproteobacteria-15]|nr:MAG: hypothetical protein CVU57_29710 [Deltaproteobacteria bacterium HGW-Deltaproteobacteria-15]
MIKIRMTKTEISNPSFVLNIEAFGFEFVCFEFRYSNFEFCGSFLRQSQLSLTWQTGPGFW